MLSVVIPVYNAESYINKCIESILTQTYTDFELILVDDGSTDKSKMLCEEAAIKDSRIKVLHKKNEGPLKARLMGAEAAQGEYIAFVDSDDWIDSKLFEKEMSIIKKGYDMVVCLASRYFNEADIRLEKSEIGSGGFADKKLDKLLQTELIWNIYYNRFGLDPSLWGKIMKCDLLKKYLKKAKNLDIWYGEDVAVIYPMMQEINSLYILDENLYYHRQRAFFQEKPYIKDEDFYIKLYRLYQYLSGCFGGDLDIQRQIEYFYMYSVNLKQQIYGIEPVSKMPVFPFDKVRQGSDIAIYGAGNVGRAFRHQINETKYCNVVCWVDKNYSTLDMKDVTDIDCLLHTTFDTVVIANASKKIADEIYRNLIDMGIEESCIIR